MKRTGNRPKYRDTKEEQMMTWRVKGDTYNDLIRVCNILNMSLNRFVTEVMTAKIGQILNKTKDKE